MDFNNLDSIYMLYRGNLEIFMDALMDDFNSGKIDKNDYKLLMEVMGEVDELFRDCMEGKVMIEALVAVMGYSIELLGEFKAGKISGAEFNDMLGGRIEEVYYYGSRDEDGGLGDGGGY
jgi:hypothetical protein